MLLIFSPLTARAKYTFDLFFGSLIPVSHRLTADSDEFVGHDGPKLCYGDAPLDDDSPFVRTAGLLEQTGVGELQLSPFAWRDTLGLFPTGDDRSAFSFDPFSAAFFLVTRYEEYGSRERDHHGRFRPEGSVLYQQGFLGHPVVNAYAAHLRHRLERVYPRFEWPRLPFSTLSTIDVDVAYAYRGRPLLRSVGAAIRQLIARKEGSIAERIRVLRGLQRDPYDSYDWLEEVHAEHDVPLLYFILAGRGSRLDRNLPPDSNEMTALIRHLAESHPIGIHPSYASKGRAQELRSEIETLERISGAPVTRSRHHFLRIDVPSSYRVLIDCGIREDYSMGYASEPGFRAGIAYPFRFYDLEHERATDLLVHPLAYMDGSLNVYKQLSPDGAVDTITALADAVARTGGLFMSLWHNNSVTDYGPWAGWRRVFHHSLTVMSDHLENP